MHPLQARLLALAEAPASAAELARRLGLPRQRVNYHVRELARAGLLVPAAQQRKRNMVEQQYVASNTSHALAPFAKAQEELSEVMEAAARAGVRLRTTSLEKEVHFENGEVRAEFAEALLAAVQDLIEEYSMDAETAGKGRPFRLVLGFYPIPQ